MTLKGLTGFVAAALVVVACTSRQEAREQETPVAIQPQRLPTIDHVSPARDAVGPPPTRFEWTSSNAADEYAIGIWDDVDRLIWRGDHIRATSVTLPADVTLEFGTYFWSVTALREGRPVAETGRSAFVVMR